MVLTLGLQLAFALLTLLFGVLCRRVAGRWGDGGRDRRALAWRVAGGYFLVIGLYGLVQSVLACAAVAQGSGSWLYETFVAWVGAANFGRCAAGVAFALLLLHAQGPSVDHARAAARMSVPVAWAAAVAAALSAGALGWRTLSESMMPVSVGTAAMALLLLAVLLLALASERMDEVLWLALTAYTLKEVLNVSLLAIVAWWEVLDARGAMRTLVVMGIVVTAGMCCAGAWRLHLLGVGRRVPSLLERVRGVRRPVIGWDPPA